MSSYRLISDPPEKKHIGIVRSLLRAGVQPTLDPSAETVERFSALAQERGGELVGVCKCVHDV